MSADGLSNKKTCSKDCSLSNSQNPWDFQIHAARRIASDCEDKKFVGAVLASAVGSGKTQILIHAMNLIIEKNNESRILYLAHAQDVIRQQTLAAFNDPFNPVTPKFSFGRLKSGSQVEITIPQEIKIGCSEGKYSHLVIDEAHVWFSSDSVLYNVIQRLNIRKLILASGTVSIFNSYNKNTNGRKFAMTYISGEEMLRRGIYAPVTLDLFRVRSYANTNEILKAGLNKARYLGDSLEKPVIVCKNSIQARDSSYFLSSYGYSVALASSTDDPNNIEIMNFKLGKKTALVLVNRGILGLNIDDATSLFFLKDTQNIELILQALARLFRKHRDGRRKYFWMPSIDEDWNEKVKLLHKTLSLNQLEVMKNYCG